jgi:LysR family transcriptional regulator, transcriptional activator of the cysJI operon
VHVETLKTFRDLVETGSFTKAAGMNHVSQSAVSQQLKALEARYGCRLLERDRRRRIVLTEAGRQLYVGCCDVLDRLRAVEMRLRDRSVTIAGTVRVATVYSIGLHSLPPYVTRFMKAHPQVKVHLEYRRTDKVCEGCLDDSIDFGIVAFPIRRSNLTVIPWREETLVLVCPPPHPLARRRRVRLARLQGADFVGFERDIPTRKTIDRVLADRGVKVTTVMAFDNIETIKRAVEVGHGVSILPETTVIEEVKRGLLARVDLAEGPCVRSVGVVHRRGRDLSTAAREFVRLLVPDADAVSS